MHKRFTIDPTFVKEALLSGRTLVVEVSEHHHKVELGPPSNYLKLAASMAKRKAA